MFEIRASRVETEAAPLLRPIALIVMRGAGSRRPSHTVAMRLRLALIAICLSASVSVATQVRYRPTETGPWRPWSFTAVDHARRSRGATAAEVQAFQARLQELAAIVKLAPAVSTPIGFAGELWGSLNSRKLPRQADTSKGDSATG